MQKPKVRLYVDFPIIKNNSIELTMNQLHYLKNVMRTENCTIFNGKDGEWIAKLEKKFLIPYEFIQEQKAEISDIILCFSIIKKPAIMTLVRQATEFGINIFQPIYTNFTVAKDFNKEKLMLQAIESAEQSGRLTLPNIMDPINCEDMVEQYQDIVIFSTKDSKKPVEVFYNLKKATIFIGPEGGFSNQELDYFSEKKFHIVNLGVNILRADTASIAAITCAKSLML